MISKGANNPEPQGPKTLGFQGYFGTAETGLAADTCRGCERQTRATELGTEMVPGKGARGRTIHKMM